MFQTERYDIDVNSLFWSMLGEVETPDMTGDAFMHSPDDTHGYPYNVQTAYGFIYKPLEAQRSMWDIAKIFSPVVLVLLFVAFLLTAMIMEACRRTYTGVAGFEKLPDSGTLFVALLGTLTEPLAVRTFRQWSTGINYFHYRVDHYLVLKMLKYIGNESLKKYLGVFKYKNLLSLK